MLIKLLSSVFRATKRTMLCSLNKQQKCYIPQKPRLKKPVPEDHVSLHEERLRLDPGELVHDLGILVAEATLVAFVEGTRLRYRVAQPVLDILCVGCTAAHICGKAVLTHLIA